MDPALSPDCAALFQLLPPTDTETMGQYIDRALASGLLTLGEAIQAFTDRVNGINAEVQGKS